MRIWLLERQSRQDRLLKIFVKTMAYDNELIITEQADADLRGIYEYIAFELLSPENAARHLDRLEESIIRLEEFPQKFRMNDKEPWCSRGLRIMPVDNYVVFYILDEDTKTVTVVRVMYNGRDVDTQLNQHTKI